MNAVVYLLQTGSVFQNRTCSTCKVCRDGLDFLQLLLYFHPELV